MASDLSDDASVFAQQKQCGSDLNLRKVVPKREMTMYFLVEKKTMMTIIYGHGRGRKKHERWDVPPSDKYFTIHTYWDLL